jgi:hypothetical protein
MRRLTITLSDEMHRALKEASVRRGKTMGEVIGESLASYGIKSAETAAEIVARARRKSKLDEKKALELALEETRKQRRE